MSVVPYERSFATCEKSIYWSDRNGNIKPKDVYKSTKKKFWFNCEKCPHSFEIRLDSIITGGNWCSFCTNQKLCDDEFCKDCFDKSFASNKMSIFWSDKNETIKPRNVFNLSDKKYFFECKECEHLFDTRLNNKNTGNWCPFCSSKKLCDVESCKICFDKSFASIENSIYLCNTKNKNINPRNEFKSSEKKFWFNCNICHHSFNTQISSVNIGYWCSFCANKQLCNTESCKICFDKSFASNEKSIYWSNKNKNIKPKDVFKISGKKYWFDCNICNSSFNSLMSNVNKGCWCPYCVNKTETILYERLISVYPNIQRQFKQEWCKRINHLPFDFCITEHKIIIELDGNQHFIQVMNWNSPENQFENDKYKEKCANDNGYSVIRIIQEDVFYNKYDWYKELCDAISEIVNGNKIVNVYMCKNGEYDKFL